MRKGQWWCVICDTGNIATGARPVCTDQRKPALSGIRKRGSFSPVRRPLFYYKETHGIRVSVRPVYLPDQSYPAQSKFVFAYFVRLENVGAQSAQLLSRKWRIHDTVGDGLDTTVEGDGVVGKCPDIAPGQIHEYESYCVLKSASGFMEGQYFFKRADRLLFAVDIPRFLLDAEQAFGPLL
jgi:ApaG protein